MLNDIDRPRNERRLVVLHAEWARGPNHRDDCARIWRTLARLGNWTVEDSGRSLSSESELLEALDARGSSFSGGKLRQLRLAYGGSARAVVTLLTERDPNFPTWLPCSLRVRFANFPHDDEESAGIEIVKLTSDDLDCAWACVGGTDIVVGGGFGTEDGLPRVGWANYVSTAEYDVDGLTGQFRDEKEVRVVPVNGGALTWVDGVRWDLDNHRAMGARDAIVSVWRQRFSRAKSVQARYQLLVGGGI